MKILSATGYPRLARGYFSLLLLIFSAVAQAEVWVPVNDQQLIAKLPPRPPLTLPASVDQKLALADSLIQQSRRSGHPRPLETALDILQQIRADDPQAHLLLAEALQLRHDFDAALEALQAAADAGISWPDIDLQRAAILRVQGKLDQALRACDALEGATEPGVVRLCLAPLIGLTGQSEFALAQLDGLLASGTLAPWQRHWLLSERAELHERMGDDDAALRDWGRAYLLDAGDQFVGIALVDLLLRLDRPDQALTVLDTLPGTDASLLRRARLQKLRGEAWQATADQLRQRLRTGREVHQVFHWREQAQLMLLLDEHQAALDAAEKNWEEQREPLDALLLLRAAAQAGQPERARPVRSWIDQHRVEDQRWQRWLQPSAEAS